MYVDLCWIMLKNVEIYCKKIFFFCFFKKYRYMYTYILSTRVYMNVFAHKHVFLFIDNIARTNAFIEQ